MEKMKMRYILRLSIEFLTICLPTCWLMYFAAIANEPSLVGAILASGMVIFLAWGYYRTEDYAEQCKNW
jgi:hypothetical protein